MSLVALHCMYDAYDYYTLIIYHLNYMYLTYAYMYMYECICTYIY